jgi:hypothetical protein
MPLPNPKRIRELIAAAETCIRLAPVVEARGTGRKPKRSLRHAADVLNTQGFPAPRGGQWWPEPVRRALAEAARAREMLIASGPLRHDGRDNSA